jgi:hypothetical protein
VFWTCRLFKRRNRGKVVASWAATNIIQARIVVTHLNEKRCQTSISSFNPFSSSPTEGTEHTEVRTSSPVAVFPCVPCFRWLKIPSSKNRFWNHGIRRTHGSQDVIPLGCFSVCSVLSVVKDTIQQEPILEPRNTPNTRKSGRHPPWLFFRVFRAFGG